MTDLVRWNPYSELSRMERASAVFSPRFGAHQWMWQKQTAISQYTQIPGVDPDDLELMISEDGLTISGEVKQDSGIDRQGYRRIERQYGSFRGASRSLCQ